MSDAAATKSETLMPVMVNGRRGGEGSIDGRNPFLTVPLSA
jgi:hypothetical protein